ncbi:MAG: hypothetical protein IID16_04705 [Candidatus Marinimicrobia bacterium]|nr:hypothetical protein [Candidatus Neomarinimicrobiota bacterium]
MKNLTQHETRILDLTRKYPEIVSDRSAREKVASEIGITEKTLRNRIADLKRYGMIESSSVRGKNKESRVVVDRNRFRKETDVVYKLEAQEVNLLDYVKVLVKWRKLIVTNFFVVSLLATVLSFIMAKTYQSAAVLMPPISQSGLGMLASLSNLPFSGLGIGGEAPESQTFIAILKSRTVMETVVNALNLIEIYDVENIEEAVKNIRENVDFEIEDEGTIRITANARTGWLSNEDEENNARQLASNIANYFVFELDQVNKELKTEQAKFQRLFIEKRYKDNIKDLKEAEDNYKAFQEKNKMIALVEQTRVAIEAAATIKAQILANEVRLGVMSSTLSSGHPEVERVMREIEELQLQLKVMDYGVKVGNPNDNKLFPVFSEVPDLGIQLARLQREVEIQNALFTFLTQQYEEAKIQEAKDTPTVQVLDEAVLPIKRSKPNRKFIVFAAGLSALVLSGLLSFIWESWNALKVREHQGNIKQTAKTL